METGEKDDIKLRLGIALKAIIKENKAKAKTNKENGIKDHKLIDSLRKLAAASGIDFGNVQKIAAGYINASISTIVALTDGLDMTLADFFSYYDRISVAELAREKNKKKKVK